MRDRKEKGAGGGKDGSWQLGANTSRWAVVNSTYQVRTGFYQTFDAGSISLFLQWRGGREGVISPQASLARLSPLWSSGKCEFLSHLHLFSALCIPQWGFWLEVKLSVSFKCSKQIQSDLKGCCFHPERVDVSMCTAASTVRDKKLAVSSFKHISWMSVDFLSLCHFCSSLKCFLCPLSHDERVLFCLCLHIWMCEHACVCMWFHWHFRKHYW